MLTDLEAMTTGDACSASPPSGCVMSIHRCVRRRRSRLRPVPEVPPPPEPGLKRFFLMTERRLPP